MEQTNQLVRVITKGIQEKKGKNIVIADLKGIDERIADFFVICEGESPSQIEAIARSIGDTALVDLKEKPTNVIGMGSDVWIALDFTDVLVHIFMPTAREFYNLEDLWEDAKLTKIPNID